MPERNLVVRAYLQDNADRARILEIYRVVEGGREILKLLFGPEGALEEIEPEVLRQYDDLWRRLELFHRDDSERPQFALDLVRRDNARILVELEPPRIRIRDCAVRYLLGPSASDNSDVSIRFNAEIRENIFSQQGLLRFKVFQLIRVADGDNLNFNFGATTFEGMAAGKVATAERPGMLLARQLGLDDLGLSQPRIHRVKVVESLTSKRRRTARYVLCCERELRANGNQATEALGFERKNRDLVVVQQQVANYAYDPKEVVWRAEIWGLPDDLVQRTWNERYADPVLDSLHTVQDGRPISLVPRWVCWDDSATSRWAQVVKLVDKTPAARRLGDVSLELKRAGLDLLGKIEAEAILPGLIGHDCKPVKWACQLRGLQGDEAPDHGAFRIRALGKGGAAAQRCRLGSLDLLFPAAPEGDPTTRTSTIEGRLRPATSHDESSRTLPSLRIRGHLALAGVAPGGQDPIPGEELAPVNAPDTALLTDEEKFELKIEVNFQRDRPVIVDLGGGGSEARPFVLDVDEDARAGTSHVVRLELSEPVEDPRTRARSEERSTHPLIVLDRDPFLVARVEAPALGGQASGETIRIGNWSSGALHGASWELAGAGSGFDLFLPPQGVGEAMEKGKSGDGYDDVEEGKPVDFRFSPLAHYRLRPSFFEQRFVEATWNLRRILGYPGQRAAGAGLDAMRFEMLYGLSCKVEPEFLRLAEIAARLGAVPGRQEHDLPWTHVVEDQETEYDAYRQEWSRLYSAYQSRLAVLEPWDSHQPEGLALDEGVTYSQRRNAKLRYPIPGAAPDRATAKPFTSDGLAGGWSWGFESANVLESVRRDPTSTSGHLARPYFSALGGWGYQKASFDNDRSTVYADTGMGRTFFYSLERIGRIGVFWNLAKHVIIYERSVAPSRQFVNEQDWLLGRPVVRKVEEYVEILQPVRRYPEFGAPPQTRCFITGVEFKSTKIPVNSRWGEDVRQEGWKVPLWQLAAHCRQPNVYPKPQVLFECVADEEGAAPTVQLLCEVPERLFFYTSTLPGDDTRTDLWQAVRGVDYADQASPGKPNLPAHAAHMDRPLPSDQPIEPGLERFTFAVARSDRAVNLVASRAETHLGAVLQNVTMMRSRPVDPGSAAEACLQQKLADQLRVLDGVAQRFVDELPASGVFDEGIRDRVAKQLADARNTARDLSNDLKDVLKRTRNLGGTVDDLLCRPLRDKSRAIFDRWEQQVTTALEDRRREIGDALRLALSALPQFDKDEFKDVTEREIRQGFRLLRSRVVPLSTGLEDLEARIDEAGRVIGRLEAEARRRLAELRDVANVPGEEIARLSVVELRQRLQRLDDEIRRRHAELNSLFDRAQAQLRAAAKGPVGKLAGQVLTHLRAARRELQSLFGQALEGLAEFAELMDQVERGLSAARERLAATWRRVDGFLENLSDRLENLLNQATEAVRERREQLLETTRAAREELDGVQDWAESLESTLIREIHARIDLLPDNSELQAAVDAVLDELTGRIQARINEGLRDLRGLVTSAQDDVCRQLGATLQNVFDDLAGDLLGGGALDRLADQLDDWVDEHFPVDRVQQEIEELLGDIQSRVAGFADQVRDALEETVDGVLGQLPDSTLRLLRAFGDAPKVPKLDFNRQQLAYFFDEARNVVDTTPVTALMDRVGKDLKALGLRIPSDKLFDRVLPNPLENFDLSQIFPDFGGLKLDNLFDGLKMPSLANDNVKVRHGADPQSRRAWVEADVFVPLAEKASVFAFGPLAVQLLKAEFEAHARFEAGLQGRPRQDVRGEVRGDWDVTVGGTPFVTFRDTAVRFDSDGRLRFDLSPDRIEVAEIMAFLTDLIESVGYSENGFRLQLIERNGLPVGVESSFALPPFDAQFGAFGISDLSLGAGFRLIAFPEFLISTHFFLGRKTAPFSLTVFILTGGGWLDLSATYRPLDRRIQTALTLGITAGASIGFKFGPVKGGVSILFGLYADYVFVTGGRDNGLTLAIMLLVRGEVRILGFISAGITLLLEARYRDDGSLTGHGTLSLKIKISWCFTVTVRTRVRYVFSKGSGQQRQQSLAAAGDDAASRYLGNLE